MNLGTPEILIIAFVVVLLFGATKLPQMARSLGQSARVFKAETRGVREDQQASGEAASTDRTAEGTRQLDHSSAPHTSTETPGTQTPGTQTPGTQTPGTQTPGTQTPGTQTPGTQTPGTQTPGTQTPGIQAPDTQGAKDPSKTEN